MQLITSHGKKIDPADIASIDRGAEGLGFVKVTGVTGVSEWSGAEGTLVVLKDGATVFLLHPQNEVVDAMNRLL